MTRAVNGLTSALILSLNKHHVFGQWNVFQYHVDPTYELAGNTSDIVNGNQEHARNETTPETATPQQQLTDLTARATAKYAVKDYVPAAELYSQATELQAEINGEMSPENAELLYAYGRCLFYVAQKTSTVLGGTAAQVQLSKDEKKVSKKRKANGAAKSEEPVKKVTETPSAADVVPESDVKLEETKSDKPYFQFQGDENFEDSSDEEEEAGGEEEEEEEDDDFATSFELLDLARILFGRKLEAIDQSEADSSDKGKSTSSSESAKQVKTIKTRIADIYDLQAEISLEGEKYSAAVSDLKSRLALNEELEAPESQLLAECHYKLSLALEAAAQDQQRDAEGNPVGKITIDWDVRNEAISHQQKAIDCCKLRVDKEKANLQALPEGDAERQKVQEQIDDVQEMVEQMEDRLTDLKKPPVSATAEAESEMNKDLMAGVLGKMLTSNASKEERQETLAKVIAGATDLSGMVKKKRKAPTADDTASNASGISTGSKRKVQFADTLEQDGASGSGSGAGGGKKAKVEDAEDSGL